MDQASIDGLESIQLFTISRYQSQLQSIDEGQSFSWFDLVILDSPADTVPRSENGVSLVWESHSNRSNTVDPFGIQGQLFDEQVFDQPRAQQILHIKGSLKVSQSLRLLHSELILNFYYSGNISPTM
jgi:hypothetical protein